MFGWFWTNKSLREALAGYHDKWFGIGVLDDAIRNRASTDGQRKTRWQLDLFNT